MKKDKFLLVVLILLTSLANLAVAPAAPFADGSGSDEYGYQWIHTSGAGQPFEWVELSADPETKLNFSDFYGSANPVAQGHGFLTNGFTLYDNHYTNIYVSKNGLISFENILESVLVIQNHTIPYDLLPNGFIAGFWVELDGDVHYQKFTMADPLPYVCALPGAAADECVVIEYNNVLVHGAGTNVRVTFEIVLVNTGDIFMVYQGLGVPSNTGVVGLEASDGVYGLQVNSTFDSYDVIRFVPPAPAARHKLRSIYHSGFLESSASGYVRSFPFEVTNNGDLATALAESYSVTVDNPRSRLPVGWQVQVQDGGSPVSQVGPLQQGESQALEIVVTAPSSAPAGSYVDVDVVFTLEGSSRSERARVVAALPTSFVQIAFDDHLFVRSVWDQPGPQPNEDIVGMDTAVEQMAIENVFGQSYLAAWEKRNLAYSEIQFSFLSLVTGNGPVYSIGMELNPHPNDNSPSISVTANHQPVLTFLREELREEYSEYYFKDNIYLAFPTSAGGMSQVNLTGVSVYKSIFLFNNYENPKVAAVGNFIGVVWQKTVGLSNSIELRLLDSTGALLQPVPATVFSGTEYSNPYILGANLSGNPKLLVAAEKTTGSSTQIVYKIIDAATGTIPAAEMSLPGAYSTGNRVDAVQLPDGQVLMAWETKSNPAGPARIAYLLFDASGNPLGNAQLVDYASPLVYPHPMNYLSVTSDAAGNAILTWVDETSLNYALISPAGVVLTPALVVVPGTLDLPVQTSHIGQGNARYGESISVYLPLLRR